MASCLAETETSVIPARNIKRVACFALGGHIATQNASFKQLIHLLEPRGYKFYGAKDGFESFKTGEVYELDHDGIPYDFAGFVAGAGRASLLNGDGKTDSRKIEMAEDFFKRGGFDIAVGSGGDDHGMQMHILGKNVSDLEVYVLNKTMDNDLGGRDGLNGAPYTDFTNGFHTAVSVGVDFMNKHLAGAWTNSSLYYFSFWKRNKLGRDYSGLFWKCRFSDSRRIR